MKTIFALLIITGLQFSIYGQYVTTLDIGEGIEGVCNNDEIYSFYATFVKQTVAKCPVREFDILKRLNAEVPFIKEHPKHKDKGIIALVINCEGELVVCQMDERTKSKELDAQIEKVFNSLGKWEAARYKNKDVDSCRLYSFRVKKGKITFD